MTALNEHESLKLRFGVLEVTLLTLAAGIALATLFRANADREEAQLEMHEEHRQMRRHLRDAFAARGVKFTDTGVPVLPERVLDLSRLDALLVLMPAALREACEALREADLALNPNLPPHVTRTSEEIWELQERALAAGAYDGLHVEHSATGETVPAVVRAFFCDPITGASIKPVNDTNSLAPRAPRRSEVE